MSGGERGCSRRVGNRFYARVRYGAGRRFEVCVPWARTEEQVEERAIVIGRVAEKLSSAHRTDLIRRIAKQLAHATTQIELNVIEKAVTQLCLRPRAQTANGEQTTFGVFFGRWVSGELHKLFPDYVPLKTSAKADNARYKKWIEPHLKEIPLAMISDADAERVMAALPETLSPASRRHVAQIMGRTLNLAVYPARMISQSPIPKGFLPKARAQKHFQFLYPKEEALLLAHKKVDIAFRLFVGILDREGMRVSELLESEWWQWNLSEGVFTANRTKTSDPRIWSLRPDVARAMRIWRRSHKFANPFASVANTSAKKTHLAQRLRYELQRSGVKRVELFDGAEHVAKLRMHDMRATFVTLSLAEGKSETWIRDRTAHRSTAMIERYRRHARTIQELRLGGLPDLDVALGWGKNGGKGSKTDGSLEAADCAETAENSSEVHGRGLEPLRLSTVEPKSTASANSATRARVSWGNSWGSDRWSVSAWANSGMAWAREASSPRPICSHVRACRRYRAIICEDRWPVRSATNVSLFPLASATVTNVARRSCARSASRVFDPVSSSARSTPAFSRSARRYCANRSTLSGTPFSMNTCVDASGLPRRANHATSARCTPRSRAHARGSSVLFSSSFTRPRSRSMSLHFSAASSPVRMPSRMRNPYARRRAIGVSTCARSFASSSG